MTTRLPPVLRRRLGRLLSLRLLNPGQKCVQPVEITGAVAFQELVVVARDFPQYLRFVPRRMIFLGMMKSN